MALELLDLSIGSTAFIESSAYTIDAVVDLEHVAMRSNSTGTVDRFHINQLRKLPEEVNGNSVAIPKTELLNIPDEQWIDAQKKALLFNQVISEPFNTRRTKLKSVAQELECSEVHAYKLLQLYKKEKTPLCFIKTNRNDKGKIRTNQDTEELIQEVINRYYLTAQKITVTNLYTKLNLLKLEKEEKYRTNGLDIIIELPHINTLRNRVKELKASAIANKRLGRKGKEDYRPILGEFPEVLKPLGVVQIDHTPLDVIAVDDEYRLPIGRPTLTLAIDVYSRMVAGFYLSFEKPNALLVGCCITHCILDKQKWLLDHDIKGEWPIYGVMDTIHVDNGKEFRSKTFEKACSAYNINIDWRPVRTPRYGGHIERIFRTINDELHQLPGTTFSNIQQKGEYNSEKLASLTLKELETWLTQFIVNVYHQKIHSSISLAPIEKYRQGILGNEYQLGSGLPPKIENPDKLSIDFLPYKERTVQKYGIQLNKIYYYHDSLRRWIKQPDKTRRGSQLFIVKYDPRDLSYVFFYDPELESYFKIPYRNLSHPPISIWEINAINKNLKNNQIEVDEHAIFTAKAKLNAIVEESKHKTKSARKSRQKERVREKQALTNIVDIDKNESYEDASDDFDFDSIKPFLDVEQ